MNSRRHILLLAVFLLAVIIGGIWYRRTTFRKLPPGEPIESIPSARTTEAAAGRQAAFAGSATCRECHQKIAEDWQTNPMAHSAAMISDHQADEDYATSEFAVSAHLRYRVEVRDGEIFHHEMLMDADQQPIYDQAERIAVVIGSGQQGHAYLLDRPGMLFASPINWYSRSSRWGLAPGYQATGHQRFERRVTDACLSCHAGRIADDMQAKDRFDASVFVEASIDCERCHGPGAQHLEHHHQSRTPGSTSVADLIVNPGRLDPSRRDAVCIQCHLQGVERVLRRGRTDFDFRPGQLPGETWTIFVDSSSEQNQSTRAVSHVEQMYSSVCYQKSGASMSCTSCHDPHVARHGQQASLQYRSNCLKCHSDQGCTDSPQTRAVENDSCIACHMPVISASDVPHAAHTNHRIVRNRTETVSSETAPHGPLTEFQSDDVVLSAADRSRAFGIAMARLIDRGNRTVSATEAEKFLREAKRAFPEDPEILESLGTLLNSQGRTFEASVIWKEGLKHDPSSESMLFRLGSLAHDSRDFQTADSCLKRFEELNPWHASVFGRHAHVLGMLNRYPEGIAAANRALELDPSLIQVRGWLIEACRKSGNTAEMQTHQQIYDRMRSVVEIPE